MSAAGRLSTSDGSNIAHMRFRPVEGLTIKAALVLGFGATVALWVVFGLQLADRMRQAQAEASELNVRYMHAQDLLSSVRAQVLLSSVLIRDALLDPNPASLPTYRRSSARPRSRCCRASAHASRRSCC
jgi:hypothetical protein